jgi:hypothetical protein
MMAASLEDPPRPSPNEAAEMRRRRRGRNLALIGVLTALALLFYAITIVKMMKGGGAP